MRRPIELDEFTSATHAADALIMCRSSSRQTGNGWSLIVQHRDGTTVVLGQVGPMVGRWEHRDDSTDYTRTVDDAVEWLRNRARIVAAA